MNIDKTYDVQFDQFKTVIYEEISLENVSYLSIGIDRYMKFKTHIELISVKLTMMGIVMYRLMKTLKTSQLLAVFNFCDEENT